MRPHDGRVMSSFVTQALRGEPLTINGDGSQTRSFCYVDDLVRGIIAMLDCSAPGPMNLGNPEERTVADLARLILQMTSSGSPVVHLPLPCEDRPAGDPSSTRADRHETTPT
jgi:dTDP-glucose 4,6-dehydratase